MSITKVLYEELYIVYSVFPEATTALPFPPPTPNMCSCVCVCVCACVYLMRVFKHITSFLKTQHNANAIWHKELNPRDDMSIQARLRSVEHVLRRLEDLAHRGGDVRQRHVNPALPVTTRREVTAPQLACGSQQLLQVRPGRNSKTLVASGVYSLVSRT